MKESIKPILLFVAASALLLGCAGRKSTFLEAPVPPAGESGLDTGSAAAAPRREADSLWDLRGDPGIARRLPEAYVAVAAALPGDAQVLARLSRAYYLVANYVETDPAGKDALFLKGVEAGEKALGLHPGFRRVFEETKDEKKAVREIGAGDIDAIFWYAANLGKWAAGKSLMVRLGNKAKLEAYNQRVMDLDERHFYGGPHRFFGALPTKVPGGDMALAKKHFEKAIEIEPNYFGTRTLYAEFWATKAQDKKTFMDQLNYVLHTPENVIPDIAPENKYEKEHAQKLVERAGEWFE